MKVHEKVSELIGNTPIIHLKKFGINVFAKCEFLNPSHSIKDRAAFEMICRRKNKISIWKNKTSIKVEILFFYKP
ncbi:pyridoxal-phosphate dependent enzyme [Campylobacter jejuni]